MKISFIKENILANSFNNLIDISRGHMHSFFVLLFVVGMWLTGYPSNFPPLQIIQSYTTKGALFSPRSCIRDYFNGSFVDVLAHQADVVFATFLYANWDADSRRSRTKMETMQSFSPIDISAIDCWYPNSSCSTILKLKRYPQLLLQLGNSLRVFYQGPFRVPHLCEYFAFLLHPVQIVRSDSDLIKLLVTKKFVVLGRFNREEKTSGYPVFYQTALQFRSLRADENSSIDLYPLRDVVFAVDITKPLPTESIVFYFTCNGSAHEIANQELTPLTSLQLKEKLFGLIEMARYSSLACLHPTDITPTYSRSNLLKSVLSSPVFLLIGPRLSLMKYTDPEGYLFYSLRLAYTSCSYSADYPTEKQIFSAPQSTLADSQRHLYQASIDADQRHTMLTSACPRWWSSVASTLGLDTHQLCGVADLQSPITGNFTSDQLRQPVIKQLIAYIRKRTVDSQYLLDFAASLFNQLEGDLRDTRRQSYDSSDGPFLVEQLHFLCCHWFHRNHNADGQASDRRRQLITNGPSPGRSRLDGLGCPANNRSLQFHLLDSELQPELAWRLAGHPGGSQLTAAIIDLQEESVYRLDEQLSYETLSDFIVDYHTSSLKAWMKYERSGSVVSPASGDFEVPVDQSTGVLTITNASQLTRLLDMRTNIKLRDEQGQRNRAMEEASLVLLYHSRGCIHSAKGEGLLLHFYAASRHLSNRSDLLFAVVDVSVVDLPWELRVERIPSVLFFPANASSYSSVFPHTSHLGNDVFYRLVAYIVKQVSHLQPGTPKAERQAAEHTVSSLLKSVLPVSVEQWSWSAEPESTADRLVSELTRVLAQCQKVGDSIRLACLTAIRSDLDTSWQAFKVARLAGSQAMVYLERHLHRINRDLLGDRWHPFHSSLTGRTHQLSVYSTGWRSLSAHVDRLDRWLSTSATLIARLV